MMISSTLRRIFSSKRHRTRAGFTIVELLIVIGIIALLIAILMPALGRARESANSLKCQAQQQQVLQALMLHAQEHKGYLPVTGMPLSGSPSKLAVDPVSLEDPQMQKYDYYGTGPDNYHVMSLLGALAPILGHPINTESKASVEADLQTGIMRQLFVCPSDREGGRFGGTVWEGGNAYSSYVFNDAVSGWGTSAYQDGSGLRSNPYPHSRLRGKVAKFVHPSELFIMADGLPRSDSGWQLCCDGDADITLRDIFVTTNGPANNPHASNNPTPGYCCNWDVIDMKRHRNRINVGFADGHIENVELTEGSLAKISLNKGFVADQ